MNTLPTLIELFVDRTFRSFEAVLGPGFKAIPVTHFNIIVQRSMHQLKRKEMELEVPETVDTEKSKEMKVEESLTVEIEKPNELSSQDALLKGE